MLFAELPMAGMTPRIHPQNSDFVFCELIPVVPQQAQLPLSTWGSIHDVEDKNDPRSASKVGQSDLAAGFVGQAEFRCR